MNSLLIHLNKPELCTEIKELYTAITRAKTRLYIYDDDFHKAEDFLSYFLKRNIVIIDE